MKYLLTVSLLLCMSVAFPQKSDTFSLQEALSKRMIQVKAKGLGGYQGKKLRVSLRNPGREQVTIRIEPGQFFLGEDTGFQRLIITQEVVASVNPQEIKLVDCFTMCTQSSRMSPRAGLGFTASGLASGPLLTLAGLIAEKGYQEASAAQSAVWDVADNHQPESIWADDSLMAHYLSEFMGVAFRTRIPVRITAPSQPLRITDINSSMEVFVEKDLSQASLLLYNSQGQVVRSYFTNRNLEVGFAQFRIGHFHTGNPEDSFSLRLEAGGRVISEKAIQPTDSVLSLTQIQTEAQIPYQIATNSIADFGVYDEAGRLCMYISRDKQLQSGYHRSTLQFAQSLLPGHQYEVRITDKSGTLLGKAPVKMENREFNRPQAVQVVGVARYEVKSPLTEARMTIENQAGEVLSIAFEHGRLNPGQKTLSYNFTSFEGPEAVIILRLVDGEGNEVMQQQIYPKR